MMENVPILAKFNSKMINDQWYTRETGRYNIVSAFHTGMTDE